MDFTSSQFRDEIRPLWDTFLDELEPLRPELFRFGLGLTRNPFDAEDLVADSLLKAFTFCAIDDNRIDNLRAFVTRVMVTGWIDEKRRRRPELLSDAGAAVDERPDPEAAAQHLYTLEPRARAVVVLKDVLGYTHDEIAQILSITRANAKVILHRAKSQLADVQPREPRASHACVQRFVEAFLTYDVDEIRKVLIDDLVADNFPVGYGTGIDHHIENGWVRGSFYHHMASHEASHTPYPLELEIRDVCGEPVVLVFRDHGDVGQRALEEVWRLEEVDGRVAKITDYCFRPDLVEWVAQGFDIQCRRLGYRLQAVN